MNSEKVKEIKKALECCVDSIKYGCEGCPYHKSSSDCQELLIWDMKTYINELEGEITKSDIINSKLEMDIELLNKQNIDLEIDRDYYQEQFNEQEDFYVEWNKQQLKQFSERLKEKTVEFVFGQKVVPIQDIDETLKEFIND